MNRFPWALGAMLMLGGCILPDEQDFLNERARTCGQAFTCPEGLVCVEGFCAKAELDSSACTPACAPYLACVEQKQCVSRYTELVVTPVDGTVLGAGVVQVRAELHVRRGVHENFPKTLNFSVVRNGGGPAGTLTPVVKEGGVYTAEWTPPAGSGEFLLTAAYPQEGGPSTTVRLTIDTIPPSFVVVVPPGEAGIPKDGFTYADPANATAWRRDQTVRARVESDSADLDPNSLRVLVRGHNGGANLEGLFLAPVTPCEGRSYCGAVDVPLWQPGLPAFRGNFVVEVTARDRVGNEVTRTGNIPVTRWKWSFNSGAGPIRSSPAIGHLGTVYFGTSDSNGKMFALAPEGKKNWESETLGAVQGSPAVGEYANGAERVYVGANNSSGAGVLYALGANGSVSGRCPGAGTTSGTISTAIALLSTKLNIETEPVETAVALGNGEALLALRPGAAGSRQCGISYLNASSLPGASVIARGENVYFSSLTPRFWATISLVMVGNRSLDLPLQSLGQE